MGKIITKISFKAGGEKGVTIEYKTFDDGGVKDETSKSSKHPPHITFVAAMQKLKSHLLYIAEFQDSEKLKKYVALAEDDVVAKNFRVCGVTVTGEGEKESIIMTGYRTLSTGLGYVFNTPNTRVESEGDTAYKFMAELLADIEEVRKEADEYLHGKYGAVQGTLFEKEEGKDEE